VAKSKLKEFVGFARGISEDYEAVKNALTYEWSNGQLEGQVNRLKLIKRQMYGRAKFDLLSARVLHSM
jgi:transposase